MATIFGIAFWQIVMVEVKEPLEKKHCQKSTEHPGDGLIERTQLLRRVRQEMQQRNSKHQTRDKTDCHLQSRMSEANNQRQPAACQRSEQNERAVNRQQPTG